MTLYETTFIINPQTDDATIDRHVRQVADLINENSGTIRFEDHMGTRRLAYEIIGLTQGYYASFIFEAPTTLLPVLERHYKLNEAYIRHLTVRYEGDTEKLAGQAEKETVTAEVPTTEKAVEAPAEDAPAEDAPAENAPAESAPAEEAAASETAKLETVEEAAAPETSEPETPASEEAKPVEEPTEAAAPEQAAEAVEEKPAEESSQDDEEL